MLSPMAILVQALYAHPWIMCSISSIIWNKIDIGGSIPKDCCLVVLTPRQTSLSEEETCSYARSWAISSPLLIGGFILSDETSCCHQWRCWLKLCMLTPESCVRFPVYFEEKTDLRVDIGGSIPRDNCHGQFWLPDKLPHQKKKLVHMQDHGLYHHPRLLVVLV